MSIRLRESVGVARLRLVSFLTRLAKATCSNAAIKGRVVAKLHKIALSHGLSGRHENAVIIFMLILELDPTDRDAMSGLKGLCWHIGYFDRAMDLVAKWVEEHQDEVLGYLELIDMLLRRKEVNAALIYIERYERICKSQEHIEFFKGVLLRYENKLEESNELLRSAVAKDAKLYGALMCLAHNLSDQGRKDEAISILLEATRVAPSSPFAYVQLAGLRFYRERNHPHFQHVEAILSKKPHSIFLRRNFHMFLGQAYDSVKDYDRAFLHFAEGNRLNGMKFDTAERERETDVRMRFYDRKMLELKRRSTGDRMDPTPVFIIGMPRSGTTLVEQILASHPGVLAIGECIAIPNMTNYLDETHRSGAGYPNCVAHLDSDEIDKLANDYLDFIRIKGTGKIAFTDKLPMNFLEAGFISIIFPNARFIYCKRDPIDTCLSCYFQNFADIAFASDFSKLASVYIQHSRIMAHWKEVMAESIHQIDYEDLVASPERHIRELLRFCGLSWDTNCLEFHRTERVVHTASTFQVKSPVYTRSVKRWKNYEKHIGELIGYFPNQRGV
ncbi:tetratricopeptide repeat-containing sulfotransferase family protein [Singulisphaera sp. PoT]|uniref:tetratricopeptide repeat-containing sulfotransferase family protein n=1 Tax=Singulisphaera sp. PoT TaxID=3411797 RepID=UPI003BF5132E